MQKAPCGIIFDCDGTLLDSMWAWREVEESLAREAGATSFSQEDENAFTVMTIPECGQYIHAKFGLGASPEQVIEMIDERMLDFYTTRASARPGALELVEALARLDVPMAVASSSPPTLLRAGLEHTGFAPYLRAIVSVDDVGKSKRTPEVYHHARSFLETPVDHTWGVEDALYAVRTLNNAGYRSCSVYDCDKAGTWEDLSREADYAVKSFEDLQIERLLEHVPLS